MCVLAMCILHCNAKPKPKQGSRAKNNKKPTSAPSTEEETDESDGSDGSGKLQHIFKHAYSHVLQKRNILPCYLQIFYQFDYWCYSFKI